VFSESVFDLFILSGLSLALLNQYPHDFTSCWNE
jgi:hypothetical protein